MKSVAIHLCFASLSFVLLFTQCQSPAKEAVLSKEEILVNKNTKLQRESVIKEMVQTSFQQLMDSAKLDGAILVFDPQKNTYHSNDFDWAKQGRLPASTFKIPNSLIALETGVVENDSTLFKWDGEKRYLKIWEQDMIFKEAFHRSCVPCYQDIARHVGVERMQEHLKAFDYGDMKVDSTNIDLFWLEGDAKISPMQQIDFLQRFYNTELPISPRTENMMKELMVIDEKEGYKLSGKTGWALGNEDKPDNGWFVGYVEKGREIYFFATNVSPKPDFDRKGFASIRAKITKAALKELGIVSLR
ncbi:MAG: class D beta-lactamase [Chitinophagales bacterium]